MMHKRKQAMIEIQFHWIFLLVAGVMLFIFIISIIFIQKERSETTFDIQIMRQITASFKGKQQISDSFTLMQFPDTTLTFECDKDLLDFRYRISGSQWEILPTEIMFSTRTIKSTELLLWTQDFQMPFTVTRFVYVTTPGTVFLIYNNSANTDAKLLYDSLSANITKFYAKSDNVNAFVEEYNSYKLICFENDCPTSPPLNKLDYIDIKKGDTLFSYGNITYYKKGIQSPSEQKFSYVTKAGLLGAIFSDSGNFYDCQMSRAFMQFELKRGLMLERIMLIENETSATCKDMLIRPETTLENMERLTHKNASIMSHSRKLTDDNYDLDIKGCPLIY